MKELRQILIQSIFEIFEKMFYTFLEPSDVHYLGFDVASDVEFGGGMSGNITLQLSHNMAKHMVSHLLNLPLDQVTDEHVEDCVKEAASMICGSFISRADRQNAYDYSPPRFFTTLDGTWPTSPAGESESIRLNFDSENGRASVILSRLH
jgi:CheY-specific phosphatase CheX